MRRLGLLAGSVLLLGACSSGEEPTPEPELAAPRGRNMHVVSTLVYAALPEAPHRLAATYQGPDLARWSIKREADEDADRRIEYRVREAAFLLPQDSTTSIAYEGVERLRVLRRMELRRLALSMGLDEVAWDDDGRVELAAELGSVELRELEDGATELTCRTAEGEAEESLRITAWEPHGKGRRPAELELWFGAAHVWSETVTRFQVESWFKERYFWPPDRADEAPE